MKIPSRPLRLVIAVLAGALATAGAAAAQKTPIKAPPSKNCAQAIVNDWYPDGDVDFLYPLDCYQKAIKSLRGDLEVYSSATEDINRAYRFAKRNQPDPGRGGKTPTKPTTTETTPATTTTTTTTTTKPPTTTSTTPNPPKTTGTDTTETFGGTVGGGAGGPGGGEGGTTDGTPSGSRDSSSVPVPLIVLGGLAVLLFAAGGAGYLSRRMRGGAAPEDDPASDP